MEKEKNDGPMTVEEYEAEHGSPPEDDSDDNQDIQKGGHDGGRQLATTSRIYYPKIDGYNLDWCTIWTKGCGMRAANLFCQAKGYFHATNYKGRADIGTTKIIGSQQICGYSWCDGFEWIDCYGAHPEYDYNKYSWFTTSKDYFYYPTIGENLVSNCLTTEISDSALCNSAAADAYCRFKGFTKYSSYGWSWHSKGYATTLPMQLPKSDSVVTRNGYFRLHQVHQVVQACVSASHHLDTICFHDICLHGARGEIPLVRGER